MKKKKKKSNKWGMRICIQKKMHWAEKNKKKQQKKNAGDGLTYSAQGKPIARPCVPQHAVVFAQSSHTAC